MLLQHYLAFIAATVLLIALPGPNVALIVANSVSYGRRFGLVTVAGTSAAMIPQLVLTVLGMAGVLTLAGHLFEWVRWIGVAYLVSLGIQAWRAPCVDLAQISAEPRSTRATFLRGFFVSLTNPKTLLFYGAFFPQFLTIGAPLLGQLALLSVTFLGIAAMLDSCWALAAVRLRGLLATRGSLRNRMTGSFYFAAAAGMAIERAK